MTASQPEVLPCRSTALIGSTGVACQKAEDGHEDHSATIRGRFTATDTWGADRLGETEVTLSWMAPVRGVDLRQDSLQVRADVLATLVRESEADGVYEATSGPQEARQ